MILGWPAQSLGGAQDKIEIWAPPTDLYNIPGLRVLLKKCPKNDGVIRSPFAHDDDR